MATGAIVSIRSISKAYGPHETLFEDFSLHVPSGQICALVGPSGVGKSTLLRLISGSDTDFEGCIEIDGVPAKEANRIGFVFQDPRLLPWETAAGNITVVNPGMALDTACSLLQDVGLSGFEHAYPHALSGGMKRRVALTRCMSVKPKLMLLDEPFVSLDKGLIKELDRLLMRTIRKFQATVILVTHEARDVDRMASRIVRVDGRPLKIIEDRLLETREIDGLPHDS